MVVSLAQEPAPNEASGWARRGLVEEATDGAIHAFGWLPQISPEFYGCGPYGASSGKLYVLSTVSIHTMCYRVRSMQYEYAIRYTITATYFIILYSSPDTVCL